MSLLHKTVLYVALIFLGFSLVLPGLYEIFKSQPGSPGLVVETASAKNQIRALNGLMTGLGFLAFWACWKLEQSQTLVLIIGSLLITVVVARVYSFIVDGIPDIMTCMYVLIELQLAVVFLVWPPGE